MVREEAFGLLRRCSGGRDAAEECGGARASAVSKAATLPFVQDYEMTRNEAC